MTDLFNNPMVNSAKKALTPEQEEEYKKIGEYMYNNNLYTTAETKIKEGKTEDILFYTIEALRSGLDPKDLSKRELEILKDTYGKYWYEKFGLQKEDIPEETLDKVELKEILEAKIKNLKVDRKTKRKLRKNISKIN